ncbi:ankyrin repeat-containing domain protein [Tuber indicum]|nr:ankyrin repeat-containing domain protein [Tuber indicum]
MSLTTLPAELLLHITSNLPTRDIAALSNTHPNLTAALELAIFDSLQHSTSPHLCRWGIYTAARRGDESLLKRLYSKGILQKIGSVPLLCQAIRKIPLMDPTRAASIIATLLSSGISPNAEDPYSAHPESPLIMAIRLGSLDILKVLLSRKDLEINTGPRPGTAVRLAIKLAAREAEPSGVLEALVKDPRTNTNVRKSRAGNSLLHYAIENRSPRAVRALLANPQTDVNSWAPLTKTTPLMFAIWKGTLSWSTISPGASSAREAVLSGKAREEEFAGMKGMEGAFLSEAMFEIVELLLAHPKVNVNICDRSGRTALHIATRMGQGKVVGMLLRHGAVDIRVVGRERDLARWE